MSNDGDESSRTALQYMFPSEDFIERQGLTLLHQTVLKINLLNLNTLLASVPKSTVDERDVKGRTALWWAARRADYDAMVALLNHGADINISDYLGSTIIKLAIQSGNQDCIKLLLARSCDLGRYSNASLPLHDCSYWGAELEIFENIINRGTNIDSIHLRNKCTALLLATQEHQNQACDYLFSRGANTNLVNFDGASVLHIAIYHNNHKMLQLLPRYHADYCIRTYAGETILHYAAQAGDLECLEILHSTNLERINTKDKVTDSSVTQTIKNIKGLTALQVAERRPNISSEWLTMFRKLIRGIEFPESKIQGAPIAAETEEEAETGEVDDFQDAMEHQDP